MSSTLANAFDRYFGHLSRRDLFRKGGLLAAPALLNGTAGATPAPAAGALVAGPKIYESIGVRPLINCRGTLTVVSGSLELPEVRAAKEAAAQHYVQLDELMDAVGKRLAELTGAEWGIVTSGCAAGLAHTTAACITGGNPDLHVRIPYLTGFAKDTVVIPKQSRNVYDQAIRSVGVRIVEPGTAQEFEAALGPSVGMVYVFAGPAHESGPLTYDDIYRIARQKNVPVLVDAAAEMLTIPNVHLQRGATLVGYSGGKCMRGPQCAGLILGRKDLVKAAWVSSAPHHGHGRSMKVGKEEIMGMLAAVEMWVKRDHKAEYARWLAWMNNIAARVSGIEGVTTAVREPNGLSNHSPSLTISWNTGKIGITGQEVSDRLYDDEPRIALNAGGGRGNGRTAETNISIMAYMMEPGEDKVVADRIFDTLTKAPKTPKATEVKPPAGDLTGEWDVRIQFAAGTSNHKFYLKQNGNAIEGSHQGDFITRGLAGGINGDAVTLGSNNPEQNHGDALSYQFTGVLRGDSIQGALSMGEYLGAQWTAKRHEFRRG